VRCKCLRSGGGRGIRTPKGLAARWISSPLPYQLRLALQAFSIASLPDRVRCVSAVGSKLHDGEPFDSRTQVVRSR
jgi:hypothetical protein